MFCANCGNAVQPGMRFCVKCGAPQDSEAESGRVGAVPAGAPSDPWQAGALPGVAGAPLQGGGASAASRSVTPRPGDVVAAIGAVITVIALFLPWYTLTLKPPRQQTAPSGSVAAKAAHLAAVICHAQPHASPCGNNSGSLSVAALGAGAGGWRYVILALAIIIVLYLLGRTVGAVAQASSGFHWQILTGLAVAEVVLVLAAFLDNPLKIFSFAGSVSWNAGAFIGLVASLAAVLGGILRRGQSATAPG